MNIGMLWFDNDSKSDLISKVTRAASYYAGKYGAQPDICFIHPTTVNNQPAIETQDQKIQAGEIEVRFTNSVLPHHFWIGRQIQS